MRSSIFLKKMGSGMHTDPKFYQKGEGVSYIDARKKGSGTPFRLVPFCKKTSGTAFQHAPSQKYLCVHVCMFCILHPVVIMTKLWIE
jgi:hypothetical protein